MSFLDAALLIALYVLLGLAVTALLVGFAYFVLFLCISGFSTQLGLYTMALLVVWFGCTYRRLI